MTELSEKSLYERLGGYDAICAAVDDKAIMRRERQLIVDFLCELLGGPAIYMGRDMKTSHDGLNISERDWEIFVKHTIATLDSLEVHGKDREDCLVVVDELADEIVENAKASMTSD